VKSLDVNQKLRDTGAAALGTADVAALLGMNSSHASKVMERLCGSSEVVRLKRGVWGFSDRLEPLRLPEHLTSPLPCYVSLQSALFYHGIISQIPEVVYAVSTARTRRWVTPLATVSIHHLDPSFFFGFGTVGNGSIKMATPEKALLDCLYLSPAKSRLFAQLPELDLQQSFDIREAKRLLKRLPSSSLRTTLLKRLETVVGFSTTENAEAQRKMDYRL